MSVSLIHIHTQLPGTHIHSLFLTHFHTAPHPRYKTHTHTTLPGYVRAQTHAPHWCVRVRAHPHPQSSQVHTLFLTHTHDSQIPHLPFLHLHASFPQIHTNIGTPMYARPQTYRLTTHKYTPMAAQERGGPFFLFLTYMSTGMQRLCRDYI